MVSKPAYWRLINLPQTEKRVCELLLIRTQLGRFRFSIDFPFVLSDCYRAFGFRPVFVKNYNFKEK
jgi:hypothetical protein